MRKLFSLMLVVLGAAALVSCSKDDEDDEDDVLREGEGEITFVTKAKSFTMNDDYTNLYLETFNEGEKITIDWGDGSGEECVPVRHEGDSEVWYEIEAEHTYAGKSSHTVTVKGKIKGCDIYDCEVTSIDVTKCPALEYLWCSQNQLTSLDVSKNTALEELKCNNNQFSASAMNKIYNDLPQGRFNNEYGRSKLSCDRLGDYSIAENKGWYVRFGY